MKIIISHKELLSCEGLLESVDNLGAIVSKAVGAPDTPQESTIRAIFRKAIGKDSEKKFYSLKVGVTETTIEINPEFVVDFMKVYGKAIDATVPAIVSIFTAVKMLTGDMETLHEKWFSKEEKTVAEELAEELRQ